MRDHVDGILIALALHIAHVAPAAIFWIFQAPGF
jgi:hypothetical protein